MAWAPEDRYLASVGLDSVVLVWCGYTLGKSGLLLHLRYRVPSTFPFQKYWWRFFPSRSIPKSPFLILLSERLRKLDQHQGFVKGVCWDPVGEFMATQSDDKTVKIWRTTDWQLEAEIRKPFEDSPGSTFFRRLR